MEEKVFTFKVSGDIYGVEDLHAFPSVEPIYLNWLHSTYKAHERIWRNRMLTETDWMLVPDATHGGKPLAGSETLTKVMEYRKSLREYNLTTDPRPEKPEWL